MFTRLTEAMACTGVDPKLETGHTMLVILAEEIELKKEAAIVTVFSIKKVYL